MNTQQPEALRLADILHTTPVSMVDREAAIELRRLHSENKLLHERHSFNNKEFVRLHSVNAELLEALKKLVEHIHWRSKIQGCLGTFEEVLPEAEATIAKAQE
jgi:AMMECR1 domain-containing protein